MPANGVLLSPACASYDMFRDYGIGRSSPESRALSRARWGAGIECFIATPNAFNPGGIRPRLLGVTLVLVSLGMVMVYSSAIATRKRRAKRVISRAIFSCVIRSSCPERGTARVAF